MFLFFLHIILDMKQDPRAVERNVLAAKLAVRILGGLAATARVVSVPGEKHQSVQSWLTNGIPAKWCAAIEAATRERGQPVTCSVLRPDVFLDANRLDLPTDPEEAERAIEAWAKLNPEAAQAEETEENVA